VRFHSLRAGFATLVPVCLLGLCLIALGQADPVKVVTVQKPETGQSDKIAGRVVDESNRPVKGARVFLTLSSVQTAATILPSNENSSPVLTTTTADGTFELLAPKSGKTTLVAFAQGYAPARLELNAADRTPVVLRLTRGLEALGRIVDEHGAAIRDATVVAHQTKADYDRRNVVGLEPTTKSDANGKFVLKGLATATYILKISRANFGSVVIKDINIKPGAPNKLDDIALLPEADVRGRVIDVVGRPITKASISATADEVNTTETASDDKGVFTLKGFSSGTSIVLKTAASGFVENRTALITPDLDITITLIQQGSLRGRVQDAETLTPIQTFKITSVYGLNPKTFNSDDGSFELMSLPPGRWSFSAAAAGYQPAEVKAIEIRPGEPTEPVVFSLRKGVKLSGTVVDSATRKGIRNAALIYHVASETKSAEWGFYSRLTAQRTDDEGNFTLDGLPKEKVTIIASAPAYAEVRQSVVPGESDLVEIVLAKGGSVSGRVIASNAATRLSESKVSLLNLTNLTEVIIPTDEAGTFFFDSLVPGRYQLTATNKLTRSQPQEITVRDSEQLNNVNLLLKTGSTLRGKVTGLRSDELPKAEIVVEGASGFTADTSTSSDGSYVVHGIPAGRIQVSAQTYGERSLTKVIQVDEGTQELTLNLQFPTEARLSGRVTRRGQSVTHVVVQVRPREPGLVSASAKTDANGRYMIEGLNNGDYLISVQGARLSKTQLVSGSTLLDIELEP
jgi:Carboxypeptidase regulatory-like domain